MTTKNVPESGTHHGEERLEKRETAVRKKPYHRPTLRSYGEVRTLTLAPSPIPQIESGGGFDFGRSSFP